MNLKRYFAHLGIARFILAAVLLGITWIGFKKFEAVIITASVVGILAITWTQFALTRLRIDKTNLVRSGGFLLAKKLTISSLAPVIDATQYVEPGIGVFKKLLIRDTATGKRLSISSLQWDESTIVAISEHLAASGIRVETIETPTIIQQLSKTYPAYVPFFIRRPYLSSILIVLGITLAITIAVLILR
jgi:hypothetical protein